MLDSRLSEVIEIEPPSPADRAPRTGSAEEPEPRGRIPVARGWTSSR